MYRAMVASVLLYGAHVWALSPKQLERLQVVQRKQLRQILGRRHWRPRAGSSYSQISNEELLVACEQPTIEHADCTVESMFHLSSAAPCTGSAVGHFKACCQPWRGKVAAGLPAESSWAGQIPVNYF